MKLSDDICGYCGEPGADKAANPLEGTWPKNDLRRAFVEGVSWWEYHETDFTMWQSDRQLAEEEAEKRYGSQPAVEAELCPECEQNKDSGMNCCAYCGRDLC